MALKNNTEGLRHQNRAVVLASLRSMGAGSHTDIADYSGLASGTVSVITGELLSEGALIKVEQAPASGRGRPRVKFAMHSNFTYLALIRISSGEVEYSLINYAGTLVDRFATARARQDETADEFVDKFRNDIARLVDRNGGDHTLISSVSISTKGVVDDAGTTLLWSPVFGDTTLNFDDVLNAHWGGRVRLTHETAFSAHGCLIRATDEHRQHLVLSLGDSIGLGIARSIDGRSETLAPPIGHMMHRPDGPLCRCGDSGCVEAFAGFYGILRTAFNAPTDLIPAKFIPLEQMTQLAAQARAGDRQTEFAFRQAGEVLGLALSRLFTLYGPMPVTVAGPGVAFYDLLDEGLKSQIQKNLRVRVSAVPSFSVEFSEPQMVFESNAALSLQHLDQEWVATRMMNKAVDT